MAFRLSGGELKPAKTWTANGGGGVRRVRVEGTSYQGLVELGPPGGGKRRGLKLGNLKAEGEDGTLSVQGAKAAG